MRYLDYFHIVEEVLSLKSTTSGGAARAGGEKMKNQRFELQGSEK